MSLRDGTNGNYKNIINRYAEKGVKNFDDLTESKLQKAVDELAKELTPPTLRAYHTVFMGFVRAAKAARLISATPEGITLPKARLKASASSRGKNSHSWRMQK